MDNIINNLINGNIIDARRLSKRVPEAKLFAYMRHVLGWSEIKSRYAAIFLKTGICWQEYCDAK